MNVKYHNKTEQLFTYLIFGIYLALLSWLVLFKFATSLEELPHFRIVKLIPFYYPGEFHNTSSGFHLKEIFYNILFFFPAGFYFCVFAEGEKWKKAVRWTFYLSLAYELAQFAFALGATDITDLIDNTLGGALGALFYDQLGKYWPKKRLVIVNLLGALSEFSGIVLLSILLSAGHDTFTGNTVTKPYFHSLEFLHMNSTDEITYDMEKGDYFKLDFTVRKGIVDVTIGIDGEKYIYKGNAVDEGHFELPISQAGTYRVIVQGRRAQGSFHIWKCKKKTE